MSLDKSKRLLEDIDKSVRLSSNSPFDVKDHRSIVPSFFMVGIWPCGSFSGESL